MKENQCHISYISCFFKVYEYSLGFWIILHGWKIQSSENKLDFADFVSRYLIKMINKFQNVSLDEVRSEDQKDFNALIKELLQFKQQLNHKSSRFNIFLKRLEEVGRTGGTFFQYLNNELIE
jgi:fructose-1,6-bisphosphatase